jgi:hypothetical protein
MRARPLVVGWLVVSLILAGLMVLGRVGIEISIKYEANDGREPMTPVIAERL